MFSKVISSATMGIDAFLVEVETHYEKQLPGFTIVGLPDSTVKESRERVTAAIKNSEMNFPLKKITVNLAPADIKKEGRSFDLPIALGILMANEKVSPKLIRDSVILGELSLDGSLRKIKGSLPIAVEAKKQGIRRILLPAESTKEASIVDGIDVYGFQSLEEVVHFLDGKNNVQPISTSKEDLFERVNSYNLDYSDVHGQENAKRALEIAAAGGHNIIMIGPPGSGKTMIAKRFPSILPPMSFTEALETTKIHSVAGILSSNVALITERPFRSPHHTVSDVKLDGRSLLYAIKSESTKSPYTALYWQWGNDWAVREGDWKLIGKGNRGNSLGNLSDARPEQKNYIKEKPEIAARLQSLHDEWLKDVQPKY